MKKKMVIKVPMNGDKGRSKALKIAVSVTGVESVQLEGTDKNQIVVVGEGVDPVKLTNLLRKKLSNWPHFTCFLPKSKLAYAELISVADVGTRSQPRPEQIPQDTIQNPIFWQFPPPSAPPSPYGYFHEDPCTCSIL